MTESKNVRRGLFWAQGAGLLLVCLGLLMYAGCTPMGGGGDGNTNDNMNDNTGGNDNDNSGDMGCTADADCDDGDACTTDTCDVDSGMCMSVMGEEDVIITTSMDGSAAPGGTVDVTATVVTCDGSTVDSFAWTIPDEANATLSGENTETVSVALAGAGVFKSTLINHLMEPPIGPDQLPPNVPFPEGEFPAGLQNRFHVVGLNPFALEETGVIHLNLEVATSGGTLTEEVEIHAELPWDVASGIRNVPVDVPVLLHGKAQDEYDWTLDTPDGSTATLTDADSQNPYFTPDVRGTFFVEVTDFTGDAPEIISIEITAGRWAGAISGIGEDGRPLADSCTVCHNGTIAADQFTDWRQTGHAEIFTNSLNSNTHYSDRCFDCHMVGYNTRATNDGADDLSDYADFHASGLIGAGQADAWETVVDEYPQTARMANVQCESCHGPNVSELHSNGMVDPARISLAADACATCHGEPLRHARFQQWQLSGHANYEVAIDESSSGSCARCHTANGFLQWVKVLLDDDPETDPLDDVEVTWTPDEAHPQTCVVCHDPHMIGTSSGNDPDVNIRISGDTPPLIAGFTATDVGRGAICLTCHNSRRGLRNDDTFAAFVGTSEAGRAPHGSAQGDVLMGENAYFVDVGQRGSHSMVEDSCVNCHMVQTDPPELLSYNLGGANHTFYAATNTCMECHSFEDATVVQSSFATRSDELADMIVTALENHIASILSGGNTIDINGEREISDAAEITSIAFSETRGRQALTFTFEDGTALGPIRVTDMTVLDSEGMEAGALYDTADERLIKAGWNYILAHNDGSQGVHNPNFVFDFLDASIDALSDLNTE